ncbi:MAG: XRE family transcriptional regulator [Alphaproteobacteria bacterium]|nr:XRE family transcriptional regulator [Alphaproteobacteria bacterium]
MSDKATETVAGSGNVFRDFGYPDADVRQAKALMGTQIMKILDEEGLSTRQAETRTGVSHSEFSRIRQAKFSRFTIDRLMAILARLGQEVELSVRVHPRGKRDANADAPHPSL